MGWAEAGVGGLALKLRGPAGPSLFENKVVKKYLGIRGEK